MSELPCTQDFCVECKSDRIVEGIEMAGMREILDKVREKGLARTFSIVWQRLVFQRLTLHVLERPLSLPTRNIRTEAKPVAVTENNMDIFRKHFSGYMVSIEKFLSEGCRPVVYLDEEGSNAIAMFWVHEGGDYKDDMLYKCTIPVPDDCIYQFAGEIAPHLRGRAVQFVYGAQFQIWEEYLERGYRAVRALVNERNTIAMNMHSRLQFKKIGTSIHAYTLFGCLRWARVRNNQ